MSDSPISTQPSSPTPWIREPLGWHEGIPAFFDSDDYTRIYEQISADHLATLDRCGINPFMDEQLWTEVEDATAARIAPLLSAGSRILDVGVGLGRLLGKLPACEKHGSDISTRYLERARRTGINVVLARAEDLPYPDAHFDVVVCTDVLEHVLELHLACRQLLRILRPGGHLFVRVPYRENLSGYLETSMPYSYVHLRSFDESTLEIWFSRVLRCRVLALVHMGYLPTRGRWRGIWPTIIGRLFTLPASAVRHLAPTMFRRIAPWLYLPTEILAVVQAPSDTAKIGEQATL